MPLESLTQLVGWAREGQGGRGGGGSEGVEGETAENDRHLF